MKISLPGLLVEYLINGSVALLWLLELYQSNNELLNPLYLAPGIYVIGMLVDFIAWGVTFLPKILIRSWVDRRYSLTRVHSVGGSARRKIVLQLENPDLAAEYERRSSRDRIARGTFVNLLILWAVGTEPGWLVLVVAVLTALMWVRFEYSSYTYGREVALVTEDGSAAKTGGNQVDA